MVITEFDGNCSIDIKPILSDALSKEMETKNTYIGTIIDKKETKNLMALFKDKYPLDNSLHHLKRVGGSKSKGILDFIICREDDPQKEEIFRNENVLKYLKDIRMSKVPAFCPLTRKQFQQSMEYWPCTFHENKQIKELVEGRNLTNEKRKQIAKYFAILNKYEDSDSCFCLVVNPKTESILAMASDCSHLGDPLQHSIMVAIDMIAWLQGGGVYKNLTYIKSDDIEGAVMISKASTSKPSEGLQSMEGYLCTDFEVYTNTEPCVMCSMALLHSRVSKVFFSTKNPHSGGLSSVFRLHTEEGLNHHFEAYCVDC